VKLLRRDMLCSIGRMTGSQSVSIPAAFSQLLTGLGCVGVGIWVKCDSHQPALGQFAVSIHCPSNAASAVGFNFTNDTINVFGDSGTVTVTTTFTNQRLTRQWMHVYAETDLEQGRHRLYVNGVLTGDTAAAFNGTSIAPGSGGISYLGANRLGAASFVGWLREAAVIPRRVTAAEVMAMYQEGAYPAGAYLWNCDDGYGTAVICNNPADSQVSAFTGTLSSSGLFSAEVPMSLQPLDRAAGYCLRLDGANDLVNITAASALPFIKGRSQLFMGAWVRLEALPAAKTGFYFPETSGGTGFSFGVNSSGQLEVVTRSVDGGAAVSLITARSERLVNLRRWCHIAGAIDYQAKIMRAYINGVLCGVASAAALETTSLQIGTTGFMLLGNITNFFNGYMDDFVLGLGDLTPEAARSWYLTDNLGNNLPIVMNLGFNEGVGTTPQDSSGNGINGVFAGITAPFGYFPNSYMS